MIYIILNFYFYYINQVVLTVNGWEFMKKTGKRILAVLLCALIASCSFSTAFISAQAYAKARPLPRLTGNQAVDMVAVAKSQIGYAEDANAGTVYGAWMTEQSLLVGQYYDFTTADWCSAFFCWCAEQAGVPRGIVFSTLSASVNVLFGAMVLAGGQVHYEKTYKPKCGDFVFYSYNGYEMGHCAITDGNGNYVHANTANKVVERHDNTIYRIADSTTYYPACYVSPNYASTGSVTVLHDKEVPKITAYDITNLSGSGFTVNITATDNIAVARAAFAVWAEQNGRDSMVLEAGVPNGSSFYYTVNTANHKNAWGNYHIEVTVYDPMGNNTVLTDYTVFVPPNENQPPLIENVVVSSVSADGFTVTCTVTDNTGISKVLVPAWTEENSTDDLVWHTATVNGNVATARIPTAEHAGKGGAYLAQIYAYDSAENMSYYDNIRVRVPSTDSIPPVVENVSVVASNPVFTLTATVADDEGIANATLDVITSSAGIQQTQQFPAVITGNLLTCTPPLTNYLGTEVTYIMTLTVSDINGNVTTHQTQYNSAAGSFAYGDVDGDGKTSENDAFLVLLAAGGMRPYTPTFLAAADMDGNGKLTAADARALRRTAMGY